MGMDRSLLEKIAADIELTDKKEGKEMIFDQLDEQMRGMDRSLLEKIAADIELIDKKEGKEMIFDQLDEQMRGMDRSLLEKIAADIFSNSDLSIPLICSSN